MTEADRDAWLAIATADGPPPDPEHDDPGHDDLDPADPALPYDVDIDALRAESRRIAAEQVVAAEHIARLGCTAEVAAAAASLGRRGPGQPGSAVLFSFAEDAAGEGDRYAGASDDELLGIICALDRAEASACSLKHAAVAELIRRRPAPGAAVAGPAHLPDRHRDLRSPAGGSWP